MDLTDHVTPEDFRLRMENDVNAFIAMRRSVDKAMIFPHRLRWAMTKDRKDLGKLMDAMALSIFLIYA